MKSAIDTAIINYLSAVVVVSAALGELEWNWSQLRMRM